MKLRFRVLKPSNNIDPINFNCGAVYSPAALNTFSLLIMIDTVTVVNLAVGALNTGTSITTPVGLLTATFSVENSFYLKLTLNLATYEEYVNVRIKIVEETSTTYDNTFRMYGFDLGKNPNISYPPSVANNTTPFDIKMIPQTWLLPSVHTVYKQCAAAFMYRDYVEKKIHIIKTSSSNGQTNYLSPVDGTLLGSGNYVKVGDENSQLGQIIMTVFDNNESNSITLLPPPAPITDPTLGFSITNIDCVSCNCLNSTSVINLTTNLGVIEDYLLNDGNAHTVLTTLHNDILLVDAVTGLTVDHVFYDYAPNPLLTTITQTYNPPVGLLYDRQYKLTFTVRLVDVNGDIFAQNTFTLEPCSTQELTRTDCNIYTWQNKGATAELRLKKVNSDGSFTAVETRTGVLVGVTETWTLDDGIYILEIYRASNLQYSYKLLNMCTYVNCLTSFTKEIACNDPCVEDDCGCDCQDCDCNSVINKENFYIMAITYLALVNKLYLENVIFTLLDTESAKTLQDLAFIQDRMTKYCVGCQ